MSPRPLIPHHGEPASCRQFPSLHLLLAHPRRVCVYARHRHTLTRDLPRSWARASLLPSSFPPLTGETRGDSGIPSRPVYSLLSLSPAHRVARERKSLSFTPTSLLTCHSPSLIRLSLARFYLVRPDHFSLSVRRLLGAPSPSSFNARRRRGRIYPSRLCSPRIVLRVRRIHTRRQ